MFWISAYPDIIVTQLFQKAITHLERIFLITVEFLITFGACLYGQAPKNIDLSASNFDLSKRRVPPAASLLKKA